MDQTSDDMLVTNAANAASQAGSDKTIEQLLCIAR